MDFKSLNLASFKRYLNPQATNDLNVFLEKLPHNVGHTALIAAAIAWCSGGAVGLYAFMQTRSLTELRAQLSETSALKPVVPVIKDIPVEPTEIKRFVESLKKTYPGLDITDRGSSINISAVNTSAFGQFREAIGHLQSGGTGWRVSVEKLCVGRECTQNKLQALLKINKVSVDKPK